MAQPGDVAQPVCVREWNIKRISDVQPMGPMLCQSGRRERTRRNPISHPWQPVLGVNLPQRLNGGPPRSTPPVENHVGVSPLGPDDCIDKIIHTRPGRSSKRWQVTGHGSNDPLLALCEMEHHVGHCPPRAARGTHPHISVVGIKNRFDPILLSGEVIEDIHACGRYNLLAESLTEREPAHTVEARDGLDVVFPLAVGAGAPALCRGPNGFELPSLGPCQAISTHPHRPSGQDATIRSVRQKAEMT